LAKIGSLRVGFPAQQPQPRHLFRIGLDIISQFPSPLIPRKRAVEPLITSTSSLPFCYSKSADLSTGKKNVNTAPQCLNTHTLTATPMKAATPTMATMPTTTATPTRSSTGPDPTLRGSPRLSRAGTGLSEHSQLELAGRALR
jgi:hypothetical protein